MRFIRAILVGLLIAGFAVLSYRDVRLNDFITMDDPLYVSQNPRVQQGLTWDNVRWAFTTTEVANWHPVTWLSHMLDCQLFGSDAAGHHWMSVALHAINSLLLLAALGALTGAFWPSAAVALLFAVHPVRVESVAWVAERKDLLSGMFGLLCLLAYAWYVRKPGVWRYIAVFVSLALGLMSKPMLVTWPCLMLVLDYWPLRRIEGLAPAQDALANGPGIEPRPRRLIVLEKIPLLALCVASSIMTMIAQRAGGAVAELQTLPVIDRLANAAIACVRYLWATIWPVDLAVYYPHPMRWPVAWSIGALALLLALTATCFALRRRAPWLIVGWLWFVGLLVPVIGIVQVGAQSMADRYLYLPQVGVLIALAWTAWVRLGPRPTLVISLIAGAALGMLTEQQVRRWRDTRTLYEHTLRVTRDNWVIEYNLGAMALGRGEMDEAERRLREAARIRPEGPNVLASLADVLARRGKVVEAVPMFERALSHEPANVPALNNLAWLLAAGPVPALRHGPHAVELAERMISLSDASHPDYASYLDTLGAAYASVGRFSDALRVATQAADLAIERNQKELGEQIGQHMLRYQANQPAE